MYESTKIFRIIIGGVCTATHVHSQAIKIKIPSMFGIYMCNNYTETCATFRSNTISPW